MTKLPIWDAPGPAKSCNIQVVQGFGAVSVMLGNYDVSLDSLVNGLLIHVES